MKDVLKNPWIVAGIMIVFNLIVGLLFGVFMIFTNIEIPAGTGVVLSLILAFFIGYFYTTKYKEIMDKKLRLNSTLIYIIAEIILSLLYFVFFLLPQAYALGSSPVAIIEMGIGLVVLTMILGFVIYYLFYLGGKIVSRKNSRR